MMRSPAPRNESMRSTGAPTTGPRRTGRSRGVANIVAIVAVLTISTLFGGLMVTGHFANAGFVPTAPQFVPISAPSSASPAPIQPAASSLISGGYFNNVAIPLPAAATRPCSNGTTNSSLCATGDLLNITNDPSMVYTSHSVLAVAYTAVTTQAPCTASRPYATTEVGFSTSTDNGVTWSTPQYLGNSNCTASEATTYTSAWQPSIAALSNGTIVLAYVEFNLTGHNVTAGNLPPWWNTVAPPTSRLVLTKSYDNGAHWTLPTVLNVSTNPIYSGVYFAPAMPSVATYGSWIYVTWERLGSPGTSPPQYGTIALLVSPNAGTTWSPTIPITTGSTWGMNPQILVTPSQRLFLAYDYYPANTPSYTYVQVATSTSNGTLFTTTEIPTFYYTVPLLGPFYAPVPRMAYSSLYDRLYVTFVAMDYDSHSVRMPDAELWSTTNNGTSWSGPYSAVRSAFYDPSTSYTGHGPSDARFAPGVYSTAVATDSAGNLYVTALVRNQTICRIGECGVTTQLIANSSDNGTTFSPALLVNGAITPGNGSWFGEKVALLASGSHLWIGYPKVSCPTFPATECRAYPTAPLEQSQVTVAHPFTGTGVTLTFHPVGLNNTTVWWINFNTHLYSANGTNDLSFAGVPTGESVFWYVPGINATTELRFYPTAQTQSSLTPISGAFTDTITYHRFYPFKISFGAGASSLGTLDCAYSSVYYYPPGSYISQVYTCVTPVSPTCWILTYNYTWNYSGSYGYIENELEYEVYCANIQISAPGTVGQASWFEEGTIVSATLTTRNIWPLIGSSPSVSTTCPGAVGGTYTYYYDFCFLSTQYYSFVSWTGTGNSSVASNQSTIHVTMNGPAFETVNVLHSGNCGGELYAYNTVASWSYNFTSCSTVKAGLTFSEKGLPNDVEWALTLTNHTGSEIVSAASPALINVNGLPVGETYSLSAWNVPTATPGMYWVPTIAQGNIAITSFSGSFEVDYSLESVSGMSFQLAVNESGLPAGALWSAIVSSSSLGLDQTSTFQGAGTYTMELPYASDYALGALPVYYNNSIGFYLKQVNVTVHTVNSTTQIFPGNASFVLSGDANVTLVFGAEYWLSVEASSGGSATPASHWVLAGAYVSLTAAPLSGYFFVGWTGSGAGATTSAQRHQVSPTIRPLGPVTEVAVFALRPPPTYTATITSVGLPAGQGYSVLIGGVAFTGAGAFAATNLSAGSYPISVPYVYDNTTSGTRYYPTSVVISWTGSSGTYTVAGNGTITVTYAPQYLLTLSSTTGGTIAPAPGTYWEDLGTSVAVLATPASNRYAFVNWGGAGIGAVNTTTPTATLVLNGPITEAALFKLLPPPPPATFTLSVLESGLPANFGWNASVQGTAVLGTGAPNGGTFGLSSTLVLGGLNGTYTLGIPTLSGGTGVRYVPNGNGNFPVTVTSNQTYNVTFTKQYLLSVTISGVGGSSMSTSWVDAGSSLQVTAVVTNASWEFLIWNGTGTGSYTGTQLNATITAGGPVTETATFGPVPPPPGAGPSSTAGLPLALGLLVGLLVVGLVAGLLIARRRRAPPAAPVEAWEASPAESGESAGTPSEEQG
jgi:Divergent InlB B-repeat domain